MLGLAIAHILYCSVTGPSTVVCYCSVGFRSSMVAQKLESIYQKQGI